MEQAACCVDEKAWVPTGWDCAKDMVRVRCTLKLELMASITAMARRPEAATPMPEKSPKMWASLVKGADTQEKRTPKRLDQEVTVTRRECEALTGDSAQPRSIVKAVNNAM